MMRSQFSRRTSLPLLCFCLATLYLAQLTRAAEPDVGVRSQPLTPSESAKLLTIADGYQIQLLAAEPEVVSPVDAAFDDRGRLWVVEMIDYPFQKPDQAEPRGRIRILSDRDFDGRYETSKVFADKINMPTGVALWRDGAVVTLGGQLVWMRDTDQDDQADHQQVWLEGFAQQNEQLRANHPRLEPDGKWYIASGLRGGKIQVGEALRGTEKADAIELGTRDVRLDPKRGLAEAITGAAQFGLTTDPAGTRMFCSNRNPCVQVVFEQSLLADNPLAGIVPAVVDVLASGEASHVYPLIEAWTTSNLHAGQFTAACGVHFQHQPVTEGMSADLIKQITRDSLGRVFACEPTGSLVHMELVTHAGSTWKALANADANSNKDTKPKEWLASRDPWFKPVNVLPAPGGGVLVIDMHRAVIEHPAWVPDELKNRPDERFGEQAGRIYWSATKEFSWPGGLMKELNDRPLRERSTKELVEKLRSGDAWIRTTSARLLIEREAIDALPQLHQLAAAEGKASVESQVIALQLIGLFDPGASRMLTSRLTDTHRLVQITALRLLARTPATNVADTDKVLAEGAQAVFELAMSTEDAWLRLEAITSLARLAKAMSPEVAQKAAESLGKLAASHSGDPYLFVAAAGAARAHSGPFLYSWLDGLGQIKSSDPWADLGREPARDRWLMAACRQLVIHLNKVDPKSGSELIARARFLLTTEKPLCDTSRLVALTALTQYARMHPAPASPPEANAAGDTVAAIDRPLWRKVREIARLDQTALPVRLSAIELLGQSPRKGDREYLASLSAQSENVQLRLAAIKAWAEKGAAECDAFMLGQLQNAGPALRPTLLELMLAKPERQAAILSAMERGDITAKQLGAVDLKRFVDRSRGDTKTGFTRHLDSILNSDRAAVLKNYHSALELAGDLGRGKQVFTKHCAACHRIGDVGVQVGPDISDSRVQTPDKLLTSIIDPNRAIDNNYFRFVVLTTDGRTIDGLIAEETADKVVIRAQNDQRHVIARSDIDQIKPTGVSMMPEGLESQIDPQSMADVIAFIKNWRYTSGQVPAGIKAGK